MLKIFQNFNTRLCFQVFTIFYIVIYIINYKSANHFLLINYYWFEWVLLIMSFISVNFLGTKEFFKINLIGSILLVIILINYFFYFNYFQLTIHINFGNFLKLTYNTNVTLSFYIDYISFNFSLLTSLIALFVYLYVYNYMRFELNIITFFFFLKGFVLSMILLLWSGNWFSLILGWELIGISSFLLINFWTVKISTLKSAYKAFSFNKLSDCFLIIAFLLALYTNSNYLHNFYMNINNLVYKYVYFIFGYISYIDLFLGSLIICSFCKSAQFGFHFWLPDSMEAPVPASALIHSATLVSAGIYLLLRFNYLFLFCDIIRLVFMIITSFTTLYGAIIAAYQTDIKKILAYSTISHCGFLMVSILLNNPYITILYLYAHGFFKSLSFMCVGNFILYSNNYQDVRKMGSYSFHWIFESLIFFICIFNLGSLPLLFNFFSKHFLLLNLQLNTNINQISGVMLYLASFIGLFYSVKLYYYSMFDKKKTHYTAYKIKALKNFETYKLYWKTSKLNCLAITVLLTISFIILTSFLFLYILNLITIVELFNFKYLVVKNNFNNFLLNYFYFYVYLNITFLFFSFKSQPLNIYNYSIFYFLFILLLVF